MAESLRHERFDSSIILETGDTLEIDSTGARKGAKVTVGRVCIDSGSVDEVVEDIIIRDRRHLSEDGFVLPIVAIDKNSGVIEGQPEIVSRGFVSFEEGDLIESARQIVVKTLESSNAEERTDWGVMQEKIRVDLKRFLTKQTSRRPLIVPVILEV
jgi:ribonuclease J